MSTCLRGHNGPRYKTGACIECQKSPEKRKIRRDYYHRVKNTEQWQKDRSRRLQVVRDRLLPPPTRPEPQNCECCGKRQSAKFKAMCLDHDHETNVFRGWLCNQCNRGIGWLGDNIEGLQRALDYLNGCNNSR